MWHAGAQPVPRPRRIACLPDVVFYDSGHGSPRQIAELTFRGQNGTVHSYDYDMLRRLTADIITPPASGVDGSVRHLGGVVVRQRWSHRTGLTGPSGGDTRGTIMERRRARQRISFSDCTSRMAHFQNIRNAIRHMVSAGVLAAFIVSVAMCIRSHWNHDSADIMKTWVAFGGVNRLMVALESGRGVFHVHCFYLWYAGDPEPGELEQTNVAHCETSTAAFSPELWSHMEPAHHGFAGTGCIVRDPGVRNYNAEVIVPWWLLIILSGLYPLRLAALALRGRRRRQQGRCLRCGYDLRSSTLQCPECGTTFSHGER